MPPAARVGDPHACPMIDPGPKPHVGGVIVPPGCPLVMIGGQPAARVGDMAACVGPPNAIAMGSLTVKIGGQPAARMGDPTAHGGAIAAGFVPVNIGDAAYVHAGGGVGGQATAEGDVIAAMGEARSAPQPASTPQSEALEEAAEEGAPMIEKCPFAEH